MWELCSEQLVIISPPHTIFEESFDFGKEFNNYVALLGWKSLTK